MHHFEFNLSDVHVLTKCLTATIRTKLITQLDRVINGLGGSYVRHLGGAIEAGALPGMNKYRTTAGHCMVVSGRARGY